MIRFNQIGSGPGQARWNPPPSITIAGIRICAMRPFAPLPQREVPQSVAFVLSLVAGCVDAFTFLGLFGFFIAQVTGSFVFVGSSLVTGTALGAAQLMAGPIFFAAGVAATLTAALAGRLNRSPLVWTLALESLLLAGMTVAAAFGAPFDSPDQSLGLAVAVLGLATMGVQSALVRLLIRGAPSTNVMTMNTTQIAVDVTQVMLASWPWRRRADNDNEAAGIAPIRRRLAITVLLMLGFSVGTIAGALIYQTSGFDGLLLPLVALFGLWGWAVAAEPRKAR
jgi:uncharacterized membrane protein YoaK (UPF0700 family)